MKGISPGFRRQRVDQEPTRRRIPGNDLLHSILEITLRLLVGPSRATRQQRFQVKFFVPRDVAAVAPGVTASLVQKDRLDPCFKELEIESLGRYGMRWHLNSRRGLNAVAHPIRKHFPFGIVLGSPEFAARVVRISPSLLRQRMKQ